MACEDRHFIYFIENKEEETFFFYVQTSFFHFVHKNFMNLLK